MKVWDGTSVTRSDTLIRKGPDGNDWHTITQQLQATQEFVANLAVNADAMPNLVQEIEAKQENLQVLQDAIAKLTVPEDVEAHVDSLEKEMKELRNVYQHAAEVLQTVNMLQQQLLNLGRRIDEHIEETDRKQVSLENRIASWQRKNEALWIKRLEKAEDQIGAVSLALGLKTFGA